MWASGDCYGFDFSGNPTSRSESGCVQDCLSDASCMGIVYITATSECFRKTAMCDNPSASPKSLEVFYRYTREYSGVTSFMVTMILHL